MMQQNFMSNCDSVSNFPLEMRESLGVRRRNSRTLQQVVMPGSVGTPSRAACAWMANDRDMHRINRQRALTVESMMHVNMALAGPDFGRKSVLRPVGKKVDG